MQLGFRCRDVDLLLATGPPLDKLYGLNRVLKINPNLMMDMIMEDTRVYPTSDLKLGRKAKRKSI